MFRSPKLLRLAEGQACVACGIDDQTVVAAHSNLLEHGKGRGLKSHDAMSAWLCFRCHSALDQGRSMSREERELFTKSMICKTHMRLWEQGLVRVT